MLREPARALPAPRPEAFVTPDDAFLQAILESPDDDTPRLIYADWLEEHGQPERAEFIRLQCLLARMPVDDPRQHKRKARERELAAANGKTWIGPLVGLVTDWQLRRGFVECITIMWRAFRNCHEDYLFRLTPLRELRPLSCSLGGLAFCPLVGRLARIDLRDSHLYDAAVKVLVESPYLANVTLDLRDNFLTDEGKQILLARFGDRIRF
jgi:uncharacterized protein (TIGR02996 family)